MLGVIVRVIDKRRGHNLPPGKRSAAVYLFGIKYPVSVSGWYIIENYFCHVGGIKE